MLIDDRAASGPGYGEFRTDYEPILARIARARCRGPNGGSARAAIVDHGNPGAWHGTSASAPATTVPCTTDAEVVDGIIGALDTHEFVFARLMGLADALGCACAFLSWPLLLALDRLWPVDSSSFTGITPKAGAEGPENAENPSNSVVAENANPADPNTSQSSPSQSPPEKNILFEAVTSLDAQLTTLHAALPPRTAFLLFSGHSDPRAMSALAARRAEFQASLNQSQSQKLNGGIAAATTNAEVTTTTTGDSIAGAGGDAKAVRWTTADDRALEEAVGHARTGLLFVGVKT